MITKEAKLYLGAPKGIVPPIRLSQYDTIWRFIFTVYNGDEVWDIPSGASAVMEGRKKDGTVFAFSGVIDNSNVTVDCTQQMTSVSGDVDCELRFSASGRIVGTANFTLKIEAAPIAGHAASKDDFSEIDQLLTQALVEAGRIEETYSELAKYKSFVGSPLVATSKSAMTDTDRVYVYQRTPAETGMTSGNWYYYDGSEWQSGGVYNAVAVDTDKTLSVENMAADAQAVGKDISPFYSKELYVVTEAQSVNWFITTGNEWSKTSSSTPHNHGYIIPVTACKSIDVITEDNSAHVAFLKSYDPVQEARPDYALGTELIIVSDHTTSTISAPEDTKYIYLLNATYGGVSRLPSELWIRFANTVDETKKAVENAEIVLPSGYKPIQYLESNWAESIDTGLKLGRQSRVVCRFMLLSSGGERANYIFGGRTSSSSDAFILSVDLDRYLYVQYNDENRVSGTQVEKDKAYYVDFNRGNVYLDGTLIYETAVSPATSFRSGNNIQLFAVRSSTATEYYYGNLRIYSCQIYENDVLLRDYVPAIRISDGTPGMYDLVRKSFDINSQDGGSFAVGGNMSAPGVYREVLELQSNEKRLENDINDIKYNSGSSVKPYIRDEADRVADKVRSVQTGTSLTFVAVSDTHYNIDVPTIQEALKDMQQAVKAISGQVHVDFYTSFGDEIYRLSSGENGNFDKGKAEIIAMTKILNDCFGNNDQIRLVGNHDPNSEGSTGYFTAEQMNAYTGIYDNLIRYDRYPYGAYGYRDFERQKIRLIVLNTSFYLQSGSPTQNSTQYSFGPTQAYWLAQTLDLSEKSDADEWQIVIFSHVQLDNESHSAIGNRTDILDAYEKGLTWTLEGSGYSYSYDFAGKNDAKLALYVNGHQHEYRTKNVRYLSDGNIVDTLKMANLYVPNALPERDYPSMDGVTYTKVANSAKSTAFQVITLDAENGIVYAHHYGAGIDIVLHYTSMDISGGEQLTTAFRSPSWGSNDATIATVSNGVVSVISQGNVIVWAKSEPDNTIEAWNLSVLA